jgi:hypothetical protein
VILHPFSFHQFSISLFKVLGLSEGVGAFDVKSLQGRGTRVRTDKYGHTLMLLYRCFMVL